MDIIVSEIPVQGLDIDYTRDAGWFERQAASREAVGRYGVEEVFFHCSAHRTGRRVSLKGTVRLHLSAACSRCLEPFPLTLENDFFYTMMPAVVADVLPHDMELTRDELEVGYYEDDRIDLEPMIAEQVFLQLPIKTICDEHCKGLCPVCGTNLNREPCDHETGGAAASPFAVLKQYKVKRKRS